MGEHDSYRETFALWVVNTTVTKVSGSDQRGEFKIGWRGRVKLRYTMAEVDMSASKAATHLKEHTGTSHRSQLTGMS